jgi:hypothetical protein
MGRDLGMVDLVAIDPQRYLAVSDPADEDDRRPLS